MIHPEKNINHHYVTSLCHAVSQQSFKSQRKNRTFKFLSTLMSMRNTSNIHKLEYCKIMNINTIKEATYTFLCNLTSLTFELSLLNRLNVLGRSSLRVLHHVDYVLQ